MPHTTRATTPVCVLCITPLMCSLAFTTTLQLAMSNKQSSDRPCLASVQLLLSHLPDPA